MCAHKYEIQLSLLLLYIYYIYMYRQCAFITSFRILFVVVY